MFTETIIAPLNVNRLPSTGKYRGKDKKESMSWSSVVCIFVLINLSSQIGSSAAFRSTKISCRSIRQNQLSLRVYSIDTKRQHRMRQGRFDGRRRREHVTALAESSSGTIYGGNRDDDDDDDSKERKTFKWWGEDPRNRSVCGILMSCVYLSLRRKV